MPPLSPVWLRILSRTRLSNRSCPGCGRNVRLSVACGRPSGTARVRSGAVLARRYLAPVALRGKPGRLIGLGAVAALVAADLAAILIGTGGDGGKATGGGSVSAGLASDSS